MSTSIEAGDPGAPVLTWWRAALHLAAAAVVYYVDALWLGQGICICFVAVGAVIVGFIHCVRGLFGDRMRIWRGLTIATIWPIAAYCAGMTVAADRRSARQSAERIVAALHSYREANGAYPPSLQALVPRFLPGVPRGRNTMWRPGFRYAWNGSTGYLGYTSLPPTESRFLLPHEKWVSSDD